MFESGKGVQQSYEKAIEQYEKCLQEFDYISALNNLAFLLEHGEGTSINLHRAFELYQRASLQKHAISTKHLANFFLTGIVVEKDIETAAQLFFFASLQGEEESGTFFQSILSQGLVYWRREYHQFWNSSFIYQKTQQCQGFYFSFYKQFSLNDQIVSLLLCSKYRKFSRRKIVKETLVKGIAMQIVQFLCHFRQKKIKVF